MNIEARGIWGSKRKREEVERAYEEEAQETEVDVGGFEASRRKFESGTGDMLGKLAGNMPSKETIVTAINAYIEMMEKMIDAPEFAQLVTPAAMKALLAQIPGLDAYPELANMMNSEEFNDPEVVKQTMIEGVKAFRDGADQLADLLTDPMQVSALLEQLPAEVRGIINSVLSGDMSAIKGVIDQVPGLAPSQKKLLSSMLDGNANPTAMQDSMQEILSDPEQVETARQQMLENPGMAEMMGVPKEVLEDPVEFAKLISQGMDALAAGGGAGSNLETEAAELGRKFGASTAA